MTEEWEPVRLRASGIASCVGIHPFAEIDELVLGLIYQGKKGKETLATDAEALGVFLESKEEAAERTLAKASTKTVSAIANAVDEAYSEKTTTTGGVQAVIARARSALREALAKEELGSREIRDLEAHVASLARTEFGRRVEEFGVRRYEEETGSTVSQSNDRLLEWKFPEDPREISHPPKGDDDVNGPLPKFWIVGKVDGIAQEADCRSATPEEWTCRPIVVEVKNRVGKPRLPPELYDQIQLVTYAYMTGCDAGDLVQCERVGDDESSPPLVVTRIETQKHERDWHTIIVPRLYRLVDAVDFLRRDTTRRREFLSAPPRERWLKVVELCDWFPDPPSDYSGAFFDETKSLVVSPRKSRKRRNDVRE